MNREFPSLHVAALGGSAEAAHALTLIEALRAENDRLQAEVGTATELLRRHVMDWGHCGESRCACSHAEAHRFLAERSEP